MRLPIEWNVPPQSPADWPGTRWSTRSSISRAALLVKVSRRMFSGGDGVAQQVGHPVGQGARLARSRPGNDQRLPGRRGHRRILLVVELRPEIDGRSQVRGRGALGAGAPVAPR